MPNIIKNIPYQTINDSLVIENFVEYSPQKRTIKFEDKYGKCLYYLEFPYIQFVLVEYANRQIFTATISENPIEDLNAHERFAVPLPLPNVTNAGMVCLNMPECLGNLEESIDYFWNSKFNLDITSSITVFCAQTKLFTGDFLEDWQKNGLKDFDNNDKIKIPFYFEQPPIMPDNFATKSDEKELIKFYELKYEDKLKVIQLAKDKLKIQIPGGNNFSKIIHYEKKLFKDTLNEFIANQ